MANFLTKEELRSQLDIVLPAGGTFKLGKQTLAWEPFGIGDYLRYVVARFESAQSFYVMMMETETLDAQVEALIDKNGSLTPAQEADVAARKASLEKAYIRANALDQMQADAAVLAISMRHPGDADVESWIMRQDPEQVDAAVTLVEGGSWGKDPDRFFAAISKAVLGRTMRNLAQFASNRSSSSASSTPRKPRSPAPRPARRKSRGTRART